MTTLRPVKLATMGKAESTSCDFYMIILTKFISCRSVYSYSLQTRAPVVQTISNVFSPPDKVLSKPSAAASTFSAQHHSTSSPQPIASTFRSSVKTVSSMQSSALKIFGSIGVIGGESKSVYHSHNSNEGDIKVFILMIGRQHFSNLI